MGDNYRPPRNRRQTKPIQCIQVNAQHSRAATSNLIQLISAHNIDLTFVQEPYLINNQPAGIPKNFKTFTHGNGRKRSAIIVNNSEMDTIMINQLSDADCVVVEVNWYKFGFYVVSKYFDINEDMDEDTRKLETIVNFTKGKRLLIAADTNARSHMWFDTLTNHRGKKLEEYLTTSNLYINNEDNGLPTFETVRSRSRIDLTISNNTMVRHITEWNSGEEESCSDHKIITFRIETNDSRTIPDTTQESCGGIKYIVKREDYPKFDSSLIDNITNKFQLAKSSDPKILDVELSDNIINRMDTEDLINELFSCIKSACNSTFRISKNRKKPSKGRSVPWWNDLLTVHRKKVNAMRRRYQRTQNNENLRLQRKTQYIEEKRLYQSHIQQEKTKSWKQFCSTTSSNPWNKAYKISAGKIRSQCILSTIQKSNGTYTEDMESTLGYMLDYFVPDDSEKSDSDYQREIRKQTVEPSEENDDRIFTGEEIFTVIKNFNPKKAPGEDGISSEILLRVFELFPSFITNIYNECLVRGYFPKIWKKSVIIPITKPGKDQSREVSKYRPISLINVAGKVLEKLLIDRILHKIYSHSLMNPNQYGFTPQKGTVDAAMDVKKFILQSIREKNCVTMVSLDVRGAFDAAWWPSILKNLKELKCPKNLYKLTQSYFSDRYATLQTNTHKVVKKVNKGCPQGSCCGPGFWNIMYNSLFNINLSKHSHIVAFADDLVVLTKGATRIESENYANSDIYKIQNWAYQNKVEFNDSKSKVLVISKKRKDHAEKTKIYLNHKTLEQVTELKYLGIYFDAKFNFGKHIDKLTEKTTQVVNMLSRTAKLQWGLGHRALKIIYKGAIIPMLTYGCSVWSEALQKQKNLNKLQRVQRIMNIKIAKAHRTLSFEASCVVAGVRPIGISIAESVKIYQATHESNEDPEDYDRPLQVRYWPHPADRITIGEVKNSFTYAVEIYTDGSKIQEKVGAAAAFYKQGTLIHTMKNRLHSDCSNNQAEQMAILKAIEELNRLNIIPEERTVAVFTDSQITIALLRNSRNHSYIIELIRNQVKRLQDLHWQIHFGWIKAHVGIPGNEMADKLAKKAAAEEYRELIYTKKPKTAIIGKIKEEGLAKWQEEWTSATKGAVCRTFFPSVRQRLRQNRIIMTPSIAAMVTGHGILKSYLQRFRIINDATCSCLQEAQTVDHVIYRCRKLQQQRDIFRHQIVMNHGKWPVAQDQLILKHYKQFKTFIQSIDFNTL